MEIVLVAWGFNHGTKSKIERIYFEISAFIAICRLESNSYITSWEGVSTVPSVSSAKGSTLSDSRLPIRDLGLKV